jgi:spore germination cell wall hydrolase CwlJ-like protein
MEKWLKASAIFVCLLLFAAVLKQTVDYKLERLTEQAGLYDTEVATARDRIKQLDCLAINIYREAGNEPFEGKVAVAQVTLNRVEHAKFPDSVCGVVYEKNRLMERVVCQFSWYCDSTHRNRPIHQKAYAESYEVAKQVLLEGFRLPSLSDAIFYHADYIAPNWPYQKITKVGTHVFYSEQRTRNQS